jgi:hypothetical protein
VTRMVAAKPLDEIPCEGCGTSYRPKNKLSRYCTSACRQRAWRKARPGYQAAATRRWLDAHPSRRKSKKAYQASYNQRPAVITRRHAQQLARYRANPEPAKKRSSARNASRRRFLKAVKTTCGCIDCEKRSGLLAFDHRDGTEKLFNVASATHRTLALVIAEIEKCDVRCAPCHARRHERAKRLQRQAA